MVHNRVIMFQIAFFALTSCYIHSCAGERQPMLLWSSLRSNVRTTGIYSASAIPSKQRSYKGLILSSRIVSFRLPHFISAFDSNDAEREIAVMDVGRGNLAIVSSQSRALLRNHRGITNKAEAVAVDWTTGNIYWTDEGRKWIFVSNSDFKNSKVIRNVGLPRGIALYPQKGLMFWSQLSDNFDGAKIMSASMSGEKPTELASSFGTPTALAIDYQDDRVYWIDVNDMAIYHTSIEGKPSDPRVLYTNKTLSMKDLHVFRDWVYVTANKQNLILMLNKTSGDILHTIRTHSPTGVAVTGGGMQPKQPGPCDIKNGGCEQFCFAQPPGNLRKCGCSMGMALGSDGTSCRSHIMKKDFFLVVDSDMQWIFQVSADGKKFTKLSLPGLSIPVQVDFDPDTARVYWTDIGSKTVNRVNLDGSNHVVLAKDKVKQPTGIALDRFSGNLYWTDEGTSTINVIRVDGTHRKTLVSKDIILPRGLVLDPVSGYMWWSDWGKKTIERSAMDGTRREVLVNTDILWVNGLSIDFANSRLYWCDAKRDLIESSNLEGKDRRIVKKFKAARAHAFGITINQDYIYWTDWNRPTLLRMRKTDDNVEEFGPRIFDKPSDVHGFINMENATRNNDTNPCQIANGNCTGLCIPVPVNQTAMNNNSANPYLCTRVCLCGNTYNGTCDKPTNGTDGIAPSFGKTCPDSMTIYAPPCKSEALVNYTIPTATDNSRLAKLELPANPPPLYLSQGNYDHRYTAVDEAGNHATCHFTITVKVIRCQPPKDYLGDISVKILNSSCDALYGSRVKVKCVNGTEDIQYMDCEQDGSWNGDVMCQTTTYTPTITIAPPTANKTTEEASPSGTSEENGSKATSQNVTPTVPTLVNVLPSSTPRSKSWFPYSIVMPIIGAIMIIILAAMAFKYYRSNSIPLMAAMEKTMSYNKHDDNADTFTLDVGPNDDTGPATVHNGTDNNVQQSHEYGTNYRRSSLPGGVQNDVCSNSLERDTGPKKSNYGTMP